MAPKKQEAVDVETRAAIASDLPRDPRAIVAALDVILDGFSDDPELMCAVLLEDAHRVLTDEALKRVMRAKGVSYIKASPILHTVLETLRELRTPLPERVLANARALVVRVWGEEEWEQIKSTMERNQS